MRSCYSTKMVMGADGAAYNVDWYFVPTGTPLLSKPNAGSQIWNRPDYSTGPTSEVIGAPRPWRDGSIPAYVGVDARPGGAHPVAGLNSWWASGAPGPGVPGLRWDGSRGFTNALGPGIFPAFRPPPAAAPNMVGNRRPIVTPGAWDGSSWVFTGGPPFIDLFHGFAFALDGRGGMLWLCRPVATLFVSQAGTTRPLKCTSYNAGTGVSTWIDPAWGILSPGEVLTLTEP